MYSNFLKSQSLGTDFFSFDANFSFSRPFDLSGIFFFQPNLNGKRRKCTSFHYRLVFFL